MEIFQDRLEGLIPEGVDIGKDMSFGDHLGEGPPHKC